MRSWLVRGLGMAVLHAIAEIALAKATVYDPTGLTTTRIAVIALLVGAAALWSALDAWLRRADAGRTWFIASLVAGPVSGVLYVIGRGIFVDRTGTEELWPAITGGAAFTALLVLVPAGLGLFVGGRLKRPAGDGPPERPARRPRPRPAPRPSPAAKD
ncbi:B-4DMT family transporter [Amycolatopsis thermophila]|nr:B-4DMT family transporter [Amycolatopsis thermophila]